MRKLFTLENDNESHNIQTNQLVLNSGDDEKQRVRRFVITIDNIDGF